MLVFFIIAVVSCAPKPSSNSVDPTAEHLIGQLAQVDEESSGFLSMAVDNSFIAEDAPPKFGGGVLGTKPPKKFPQMQKLVSLGVAAMPSLIQHLDDDRPTKLMVGGQFFTFAYFGDEYDPKDTSKRQPGVDRSDDPRFSVPNNKYVVRIGDVCYALIGQIVNRNLLPVRYQPTSGLVINSPIVAPDLIKQVKRDWDDINVTNHMTSLISDIQNTSDTWRADPALERFKFYYPGEYERQKKSGSLKDKIAEFEVNWKASNHKEVGQ